jgi:hypothetical protein
MYRAFDSECAAFAEKPVSRFNPPPGVGFKRFAFDLVMELATGRAARPLAISVMLDAFHRRLLHISANASAYCKAGVSNSKAAHRIIGARTFSGTKAMLNKIIIAGGVAVGLAFAVPKIADMTAATIAVNSSPIIKNMADPARAAKINATLDHIHKLQELCFKPNGDPLSEACKEFEARNQ